MIIDCAVYREGERVSDSAHRSDVASARAAADSGGGFLWIGLYEPSAVELQEIADELGLHRLAVEDAVKAHQRPKVERYGDDSIFLVIKSLHYDDAHDAVETGEIAIFLSERYIVTVRHGEGSQLADVRHRAEEDLEILGNGPVAALYAILDEVVDRYEVVASELETDVEEVEKSVFSPDRTQDSERIYGLKREALEVRRAVVPLRDPLIRFMHNDVAGLSAAATPFFRDVADHLARVADTVDSSTSCWTARCRPPGPAEHPAERGHAEDLGLGRAAGRPDGGRRHLRDELRPHARAGLVARLPAGPADHGRGLVRALPVVQALRLALDRRPTPDLRPHARSGALRPEDLGRARAGRGQG